MQDLLAQLLGLANLILRIFNPSRSNSPAQLKSERRPVADKELTFGDPDIVISPFDLIQDESTEIQYNHLIPLEFPGIWMDNLVQCQVHSREGHS